MKIKTMIATTMSAMLLLTGLAGAYHIPTQDADPTHPARQWVGGGVGNLVIQCESIGPADPYPLLEISLDPVAPVVVGVNPPAPLPGDGGICFANSQDFYNETVVNDPLNPFDDGEWEDNAKKQKKVDDAANQTTDDAWSYVHPFCTLHLNPVTGPTEENCDPVPDEFKNLTADWFARVGSNAHSCFGAWDQEFRYKEMLAYFHGTAPNPNGVSGHVTFFVQDPAGLEGSYHNGKGAGAPEEEKTNEEFLCSNSNFVGLSDTLTKPKED